MKLQTKNVSPWKLGALISLITLLFIAFACSEELDSKSDDISAQNKEADGEIFTEVETLPEYKGGMEALYKFMASEVQYPKEARQLGVEGKVFVQFIVEKDGLVTNVEAIKGIGSGCDDEAVRVVKKIVSFNPGKQRNMPVRVQMVMPIVFTLQEGKKNADNSQQGAVIIEKAKTNQGNLQVQGNYQSGEWTGNVMDPEGNVLPGAHVIIAGTTIGAVTDKAGRFSLKADEPGELVVSFVGYETARIK